MEFIPLFIAIVCPVHSQTIRLLVRKLPVKSVDYLYAEDEVYGDVGYRCDSDPSTNMPVQSSCRNPDQANKHRAGKPKISGVRSSRSGQELMHPQRLGIERQLNHQNSTI